MNIVFKMQKKAINTLIANIFELIFQNRNQNTDKQAIIRAINLTVK